MSSHMFTGATIGTISNSVFGIGTSPKQLGVSEGDNPKVQSIRAKLCHLAFDKLSAATAHGALHNAPARTHDTQCHQHTRINVLDHLERWAQGICEEGAPLFWLNGGAGAGKSAIVQTLSERCVVQGLALGSFFFSRDDPTRNSAMVLISTLAYQVSQLFPQTLKILQPIIDSDPLIFKKSLDVQVMALLVQPLQHLIQLGIISDAPNSPRVFLIDGLDECDNSDQQYAIIRATAAVCHEHHIPVKFLFASRPEVAISTSFRSYKQANRALGSVSLSEDPDAKADIRRFIEDEFRKMHFQHPFNDFTPSEWPHVDDINKLVRKASSHFIYASTAMKYIWSAKESPVRSLQVILGVKTSRTVTPFAELDALYHHIFRSAAHLVRVRQIVTYCAFSEFPSLVTYICIILKYSADDLSIFLADMAPLVVLSQSAKDPVLGKEVKLLHASLRDFLCDPARSESLYIDKDSYLVWEFGRSIQLFDLYSQNQSTDPDWPVHTGENKSYQFLVNRILLTMEGYGHFVAIQEMLRDFTLRRFHECNQRLRSTGPLVVPSGFTAMILLAAHDMSVSLFRIFAEEFFDVLESSLSTDSMPLALILLPLVFLRYPPKALCEILSYHFHGTQSHTLLAYELYELDADKSLTVLDLIARTNLASIRHWEVHLSPERLAAAAEAIFSYLIDAGNWHHSSIYSINTLEMVENLLHDLMCLLPEAGLSENIILFSNMPIPQSLFQHKPGLFLVVEAYFYGYNARFRSKRLEQLNQRIERGCVAALIEKSHILYVKINTLD